MSKKEKLLLKLLAGYADANFDLDDLVSILLRKGFEERATGGSHRIFSIAGKEGIINIQTTKNGKAKPYQVKQVQEFLVNNKLVDDE